MLNRLTELKKRNEGFTIIEVLIVLAIAALILVVVLVAIPQLQRNQRNTARKDSVSRVIASINDFQSNSNGSMPSTVADLTTIINNTGTVSQYTFTATPLLTALPTSGAGTANTLTMVTATNASAPVALIAGSGNENLTSMQIVKNAKCSTTTTGATTYDSNARRVALQYLIESGNSGVTPVCQDAQ